MSAEEWTLAISGGSIAVTILIFLAGLFYQIKKSRNEERQRAVEESKRRKLESIANFAAYRFVLTTTSDWSCEAKDSFNAALGRIPIEFHDSPRVLQLYSDLSSNFTAEKFYAMIKCMMSEISSEGSHLENSHISTVPKRDYRLRSESPTAPNLT